MLDLLINNAVRAIEVVAALMIAASAGIGGIEVGAALLRRAVRTRVTEVRLALAERPVLSLEFLIAADTLNTVIAPTLDPLAVLGRVILIRTVLNLSIAYELMGVDQGRAERPQSLPHPAAATQPEPASVKP
jgi:uncharacterized membrane protein